MKMKVKLSKQAIRFIEANAAAVDGAWYYMPFYWKRIDKDIFEQITFDKVPEYVKELIKENEKKKMWTKFFDRVFVISICKDQILTRLFTSLKQLEHFDIEVELFEATYNPENGAVGLRETMIRLFHKCLDKGYSRVLILEDDISIIGDVNKFMPLCLAQLPANFDLLYLGAYVVTPFKERYSENLLLLDKALTTHAVAYSKKAIEKILPIFEKHAENPRDTATVDMLLLNRIVSEGKSYITYPLLVSQQQGYSHIMGKEIDYKKYIEVEYEKHLNAL